MGEEYPATLPWSEEEMHVSLCFMLLWPQVCSDGTKLTLSSACVHSDVSHLYFLIDLLKHPRDDILPFHRLDLISSWPDILQKHLLALCIHSWGNTLPFSLSHSQVCSSRSCANSDCISSHRSHFHQLINT